MAGNLTPEQLAQLYAQFQAGNYGLNSQGFAPTAVVHSGEDAGSPSQLLGFGGGYSGLNPGSTYDLYGTGGAYAGQRTIEDGGQFKLSDYKDLGQAIATMLAAYAGGAGLAAAGAGSAAGIGGSGFAAGGATAAGAGAGAAGAAGAAGGSGAFLGEGVASGIPAWDAAATNAGLSLSGGSAAAGAGTDIFGGNGMATGFTDTSTAGGALDTAYAGSGALTGANGLVSPELGSAATTGSNLLNTAKNATSGLGSLLGPAATLLGAAAGSQGQKSTETANKDIPEWLKPYVTGQGGLLQGAQSLFQRQTAPGALSGYDQMQNTGLGLLQQPIAGNGYAQFAAMPRFGVPR